MAQPNTSANKRKEPRGEAPNRSAAVQTRWDGGVESTPFGFWSPIIEVFVWDGKFVVRADLPGLLRDDIKVETQDDALVIKGERYESDEEAQGGSRRSERRYGRFYRSVPLPEGAQAEQAHAALRNGVLEVTIPLAGIGGRSDEALSVETAVTGRTRESRSAATRPPHVSKAG